MRTTKNQAFIDDVIKLILAHKGERLSYLVYNLPTFYGALNITINDDNFAGYKKYKIHCAFPKPVIYDQTITETIIFESFDSQETLSGFGKLVKDIAD
jgi:hypothetical protein